MRSRSRRFRKRNSKTPLILSILLVLVLAFSAVFYFTDVFENIIKKEPKITVETKSEQIENDIKLQTETKESNTFTSYVAYPLTDKKNIDLPIYNWVTDQEEKFYEEMEQTEILLGDDFQAHFDVQTEVETVNENIMSFVVKAEQLIEADNEFSTVKTYVVDLAEDKILKLTDLFKKNDIEKKGLYLKIKDALADSTEIDTNLLKEYLGNSENIKWTLDPDNITFHFDQDEIAENNPALTVEIPLLNIYQLAKDGEYNHLIIIDKVQTEIDRIAAAEKEEARKKAEAEKELDVSGKYVALTFDDGPSNKVTPRVLDVLKEYDANATFYMLGQNVAQYPEIARRVADEGHEVANHTITHANLNAVSADRVKKEIFESMDQIEKATGVKPETFRPPYGNYNQTVIDNVIASEQSIIMWSVDTLDWQSRNADAVLEKVRNQTKSGSIVLMHDIHSTTADALPQIMEYLTNEGYEFVTVSKLMPLLDEEDYGPYYGK